MDSIQIHKQHLQSVTVGQAENTVFFFLSHYLPLEANLFMLVIKQDYKALSVL